jgi:hypothetical protein
MVRSPSDFLALMWLAWLAVSAPIVLVKDVVPDNAP